MSLDSLWRLLNLGHLRPVLLREVTEGHLSGKCVCKCFVHGKPHAGGKAVPGGEVQNEKEIPRLQDLVTEQKVTLTTGRGDPGQATVWGDRIYL